MSLWLKSFVSTFIAVHLSIKYSLPETLAAEEFVWYISRLSYES